MYLDEVHLNHPRNAMAYSPKGVMDIYQIFTRWHAGYSISEISRALGLARKTVRRYVHMATACGLSLEEPLPGRDELTAMLLPLMPITEREMPAREQFEPYREEIMDVYTSNRSAHAHERSAQGKECLRGPML